jgi:hypothetical protein
VSLPSAFGHYTLDVKATSAGFQVDRSLTMRVLTVKPEQYRELRAFLNQVRRADRIGLTFVRSEGGP